MYLSRSHSILIAVSILILFFIVGLALLPKHTNRGAAKMSLELDLITEEGPKVTLNQFHRSETRNGEKLWEIEAKSGEYLTASNTARLQQSSVWFYKKGKEPIKISSDKAEIELEGSSLGKAHMNGNVKITYGEKGELLTDQATYDKAEDSISSPTKVKIHSALIDVTGDGLTGKISTKEFKLLRNVDSVIRVKDATKKN